MKKEEKLYETIYIEYTCEICGKISFSIEEIENCEKSHNCKHQPRYYFEDASDGDAWWFNTKSIKAECKLCSAFLGEASFENIENDQDKLKLIYGIIRK
jgi:hypothetical protein